MDILSSAMMLFLIMDPLGNLPAFISILKKVSPERRRKVLARELLIALMVMLIFLFAGKSILRFMGLEQSSVSIAGGIILLIIAIRMIFPSERSSSGSDEDEHEEPFIVPLAIPLMAGPSLMAAVILVANRNPGHLLASSLSLVSAWFVCSCILMCSSKLMNLLGKRGLIALERLMGMILVMLSVQMFLGGLIQYIENMA